MRTKRTIAMLLSALLALTACVTALPKVALAAETYTMDFTLTNATWNGATKNYSAENDSGRGWSWTANTKTLTLSGLQFETDKLIAIDLPGDSVIELTPGTTNTVKATGATNEQSYGIRCYNGTGDLAIIGDGALTATGGNVGVQSVGIGVAHEIAVSGGSKLTGVGGVADARSVGIDAVSLTVADTSAVKGQGGSVTLAVGAGQSVGVSSNLLGVSNSAKLTGIAGDSVGNSYGIRFDYSAGTISGGTVVADASAGTAPTKKAFQNTPAIARAYATYYWRTSDTGDYRPQPFSYNDELYAEIRPDLPGPVPVPASAAAAVPKTGDNAPLLLLLGLALLSGAGLVASRALRKRKETR